MKLKLWCLQPQIIIIFVSWSIRKNCKNMRGCPFKVKALPVWGDERPDGDGSLQSLFNIQVTWRFVKHKTKKKHTTNTPVSHSGGGESDIICEGAASGAFPHMSACWMQTTAQANLCSSPPERSSTFLSRRWVRSARQQHRKTTNQNWDALRKLGVNSYRHN